MKRAAAALLGASLAASTGCFGAFGDYIASHSFLSCSHMQPGASWYVCNLRTLPTTGPHVFYAPPSDQCGVAVCVLDDAAARALAVQGLGRDDAAIECRKQGQDLLTQIPPPMFVTCLDPEPAPCIPEGDACNAMGGEGLLCCEPSVCGILDPGPDPASMAAICCRAEGTSCDTSAQCCTGTLGCIGGVCACTPTNGACTAHVCCDGYCEGGVCCAGLLAPCQVSADCCAGLVCSGLHECEGVPGGCGNDGDLCGNPGEPPCCQGLHCSLSTCSYDAPAPGGEP